MHSTQRLPKVLGYPRYNNAEIDGYVRMPKYPSPVDEMLLKLYEDKMPLWNLPSMPKDNWLPH